MVRRRTECEHAGIGGGPDVIKLRCRLFALSWAEESELRVEMPQAMASNQGNRENERNQDFETHPVRSWL